MSPGRKDQLHKSPHEKLIESTLFPFVRKELVAPVTFSYEVTISKAAEISIKRCSFAKEQ